jgi:Domain of unknown function (DUF4157)
MKAGGRAVPLETGPRLPGAQPGRLPSAQPGPMPSAQPGRLASAQPGRTAASPPGAAGGGRGLEAPALQGALGNQAVMSLLGAVERSSPAGLAGVGGGAGAGPTPAASPAMAAVILEDAAPEVGPGQMRKSEFLSALRGAVTQTAEEGLAAAGRTTRDCPYLRFWFGHYQERSAAHLGRAVRRYAPETARAADAGAWLGAVSARVRRGVDAWVAGGDLAGVPEEIRGGGALATLPGRLGPGRALDAGVRQRMESIFGSAGGGLGGVRIHTEARAGALVQGMAASAVTEGEDIAFAPGRYQPGTPVGDAILAHELAHVIQQRGAGEGPAAASGSMASPASTPLATPALEPAGSPLEREAENAAAGAVLALWGASRKGARGILARARPTARSGRRLQRCSNSVAHPPHVFKSCGFSASIGGPIAIQDDASAPAPGKVDVTSPAYSASGEVKISGGTDAQASDWQAGFMQTGISLYRRANYFNAAGNHHKYLVKSVPTPTRDALSPAVIPWYGSSSIESFTATDSSVKPEMSDQPETHFPWKSPDGAGTLAASDGKDQFCSWLMVRQVSSGAIEYLNWATWEVDWAATFDPVAKTGRGTGGGGSKTGSGDGQGTAVTPQLTNPTANQVLNSPPNPQWI